MDEVSSVETELRRAIVRQCRDLGYMERAAQIFSKDFVEDFSESFAQCFGVLFETAFVRRRVDVMCAALSVRYGKFDDLEDLGQRLADGDYFENFARVIVVGTPLAEVRFWALLQTDPSLPSNPVPSGPIE